ncbi:hypothetical protein B0A48_13841 [Cryoendolithus antarcticus]|uniref:Uncharacterized protein n=1 Tax=Cryoendolithus antarcticus TaxID=1507870 RepID=A0A1V8SNN0_9PEZI|nr:hypothetical protein B0A48_13841 [Cryoendolithus antarcticus]
MPFRKSISKPAVEGASPCATFTDAYTRLRKLYNAGGPTLQTFIRNTHQLLQDTYLRRYRKALLVLARTIPAIGEDWTVDLEFELHRKRVILLDSAEDGKITTFDEVWQSVEELKEIVDAVLAPKHGRSQTGVLTGRQASAAEKEADHDEVVVLVNADDGSVNGIGPSTRPESNGIQLVDLAFNSISLQPNGIADTQPNKSTTPSAARLEIMRQAKDLGYHDEPSKPSAKLKDLFATSVELGFGGDQPYKDPMLKRAKSPPPADP